MPLDERRLAIIEATLPLVLEHGAAVSTRMIAEAAGIAEGTIFRAFPDKDTLLEAVAETAFDPAPLEAALAEIDRGLDLDARLVEAVAVLQRRTSEIWRLASTIGVDKVPAERRRPIDLPGLAALFEPDRDELVRDPVTAARMLRGLTLAFSHPILMPEGPVAAADIVSLLLDGIRSRPATTHPADSEES
jgi:AcrR family transcriptional regulator